MKPITIGYIVGCSHSGSTLLNRVLGAHPKAINMGGSYHVSSAVNGGKRCSCGAPLLAGCPFWSSVNEELRQSEERSLAELDVTAVDSDTFNRDNLSLFRSIRDATGTEVIIDSSRSPRRLWRLSKIGQLDVVPIHLYKEPLAQANSWMRKNMSFSQCAKNYWRYNLGGLVISRRFAKRIKLSYESFCQKPDYFLHELLAVLSLGFDSKIIESWGENPIHVLGGNRMRLSTSSEIRLDKSWNKRFTPSEVRTMNMLCLPLWRLLRR